VRVEPGRARNADLVVCYTGKIRDKGAYNNGKFLRRTSTGKKSVRNISAPFADPQKNARGLGKRRLERNGLVDAVGMDLSPAQLQTISTKTIESIIMGPAERRAGLEKLRGWRRGDAWILLMSHARANG